MSHDPKGDQARAVIAALQTILDNLPESGVDIADAYAGEDVPEPVKDPTYALFVNGVSPASLAGLFTSIRIIHSIYARKD